MTFDRRAREMQRVLVVEDEPMIAGLVAKVLRQAGHNSLVAEDGELGLFLATTDDFDVVVLDLGLPGMTGQEVLQKVLASRPELRIVVLTGHDDARTRMACLAAGAAAFLSKPFASRDLCDAVAADLVSS